MQLLDALGVRWRLLGFLLATLFLIFGIIWGTASAFGAITMSPGLAAGYMHDFLFWLYIPGGIIAGVLVARSRNNWRDRIVDGVVALLGTWVVCFIVQKVTFWASPFGYEPTLYAVISFLRIVGIFSLPLLFLIWVQLHPPAAPAP